MTETEEEKKRPVPDLLRRSMREENIKFNPPKDKLRRYSKKDNIVFIKDKTLLDGSDEIDPEIEDTFLLLSKADNRSSRRYSMENNFALFKEEPTANVAKSNGDREGESHDECSVRSSTSAENDSNDRMKNPFWVVYNIQKFQKNIEHSKLANEDNSVSRDNSNSKICFYEEKIPVWIAQKLKKRLSRTKNTSEKIICTEAHADEMDKTKTGIAITNENLAADPNIDVICLTQFPDEEYTCVKFNEKLPEIFEGDNDFVLKDGRIKCSTSQVAKISNQFFLFKKNTKTSITRKFDSAVTA